MSLAILAPMVVVLVAAMVFAVHSTGGSAKARIEDADHARRLLARDFPDVAFQDVHITADRETAFLLGSGVTGIVHVVGAGFLTRLVNPEGGAHASVAGQQELILRLDDFTWRGGTFTFSGPDAAAAIAAAISAHQKAAADV